MRSLAQPDVLISTPPAYGVNQDGRIAKKLIGEDSRERVSCPRFGEMIPAG